MLTIKTNLRRMVDLVIHWSFNLPMKTIVNNLIKIKLMYQICLLTGFHSLTFQSVNLLMGASHVPSKNCKNGLNVKKLDID